MNTKILELIAIVEKNYDHIQQLETLSSLLRENHPEEFVVARTTHNAHYGYRLFGHKKFQIEENHINTFLDNKWLIKKQIVAINKPLIVIEDGEVINWD